MHDTALAGSAGASNSAPALPVPFRWGLLLVAGFMAFVAWDQSYWWRVREDFSFGWLVPLFIAYLVYDRWPRIVAQARGNGPAPVVGSARGPGWFQVATPAALLLLILAGALFVLGAFYRTAAGVTHLSTLAITAGMAGTVLATIYLLAPTAAVSPQRRAADRGRMVQLFLYPALLWLLSAPMLTVVENNLNVFLMHQVTTVVFSLFDLLGLPLMQKGNLLILPTGSVGVEEACSGIRSLIGCLFAGSFLAAVFLRSWWKQTVLILASLGFALASNLIRSIFLTAWAYRHGAGSIEGPIHDISGYAVLGLTVVALLGLLPLLDRRERHSGSAA